MFIEFDYNIYINKLHIITFSITEIKGNLTEKKFIVKFNVVGIGEMKKECSENEACNFKRWIENTR